MTLGGPARFLAQALHQNTCEVWYGETLQAARGSNRATITTIKAGESE